MKLVPRTTGKEKLGSTEGHQVETVTIPGQGESKAPGDTFAGRWTWEHTHVSEYIERKTHTTGS